MLQKTAVRADLMTCDVMIEIQLKDSRIGGVQYPKTVFSGFQFSERPYLAGIINTFTVIDE